MPKHITRRNMKTKIKIEDLIAKGQEEYIELYSKENRTKEEQHRMELLEKQINYVEKVWCL